MDGGQNAFFYISDFAKNKNSTYLPSLVAGDYLESEKITAGTCNNNNNIHT